jgi:hypothetical protein
MQLAVCNVDIDVNAIIRRDCLRHRTKLKQHGAQFLCRGLSVVEKGTLTKF